MTCMNIVIFHAIIVTYVSTNANKILSVRVSVLMPITIYTHATKIHTHINITNSSCDTLGTGQNELTET
jgi:hypothetical protein